MRKNKPPVTQKPGKAPPAGKKKPRGAPFKKGAPRPPGAGRKKGTPNAVTREVKAIALELLGDPTYRQSLKVRLQIGEAGPIEPLLWHYAYGKPKEQVHISSDPVEVVIEYGSTGEGDSAESDDSVPEASPGAGRRPKV